MDDSVDRADEDQRGHRTDDQRNDRLAVPGLRRFGFDGFEALGGLVVELVIVRHQNALTPSTATNMPWPVASLVNRVPLGSAAIVHPAAL
ncbi:hypothetical protein MCNF_42250 [Mycolicibacterium confluentis]|uniref:Uncharacterized protein n=1 Tax=Mycolicibacterium confluentis TaxID=28047 RepID=A0A7I7Y1U1_9MYCO|nr:hypothetical protein MCNF_42250 [Mycolicibacterium confluentis]